MAIQHNFKGGTNLPEKKQLTEEKPIENMPLPKRVILPLKQHFGVECSPIVKPKQKISLGECIGLNDKGLSARVHASISGVVTSIEERALGDGSVVNCIIIEGQEEKIAHDSKDVISKKRFAPSIIRQKIEEAGIVGLGGACFPTHVKVSPPKDKTIDTVIINGAECEPYLTVDHRLMVEKTAYLFRGMELIREAVGANRGIVACEINKPDALQRLQEEAKNWKNSKVVSLGTRYPHGAEKVLIHAVLNREVPLKGLPFNVGVVVNNVQTTIAIAYAVDQDRSLTSRVLTISGEAIANPKNLRVPLGTPLENVIQYCGGLTTENYRAIMGGPMTGKRIRDFSIPIIKNISGITFLPAEEYAKRLNRACIRCGKCVQSCPMYLSPNQIVAFIKQGRKKEAIETGLFHCFECSTCAYVCPSKRSLVSTIQQGKSLYS